MLLALATFGALAAATLGNAGVAQASCIYNVGKGSTALAVGFSSTGSGVNGYSSSALGVGQSQCWYAHGWTNGFVAITGSPPDLLLPEYFGGIDVAPHGWVEVSAINSPEGATNELCSYLVPAGWAHYDVFGRSGERTASGSNTVDVGTDCFNPINPVE